MGKKGPAAVGMSGGVDSTAAAVLLKETGWEVKGFTLKVYQRGNVCCGLEDVDRARDAASMLGIGHCIIDARPLFEKEVVEPFVDAYITGRTPSPCITCNERIKFGLMLETAHELGCAVVATGHYANVKKEGGLYALYRGAEVKREQSYFLHRLTQRQLAQVMFPLGGFQHKSDAEVLVHKRLLPDPHRVESQDVCFVPDGDYAGFIASCRRDLPGGGAIVDTSGRKLGTHEGIHRYTIGQRRGLGVAYTEPLYVIRLVPGESLVVVGTRDEALGGELTACDVNWIAGNAPADSFNCLVQVRYRHTAVPAEVSVYNQNRVHVRFEEPQFAITPGQAAVFYEGEKVLGGGWIEKDDG